MDERKVPEKTVWDWLSPIDLPSESLDKLSEATLAHLRCSRGQSHTSQNAGAKCTGNKLRMFGRKLGYCVFYCIIYLIFILILLFSSDN